MTKLPFLKNRQLPRQEQPAPDAKLVQGSAQDHLEHAMSSELMGAVSSKDVRAFRAAIEALVLSMFDFDGDDQ